MSLQPRKMRCHVLNFSKALPSLLSLQKLVFMEFPANPQFDLSLLCHNLAAIFAAQLSRDLTPSLQEIL